jgi:hypothetical protein
MNRVTRFLVALVACAFVVLIAMEASAVEIGDFKSTTMVNYLRQHLEPQERLNILTFAEYKRAIFSGDYTSDFRADNGQEVGMQQKTMVGVKLYDELSVRYQYENFENIKTVTKTVKGKLTTKVIDTQYDDNRIGLGYKYRTELFDTVKVMGDLMVLHEKMYDYRTELAVNFDTKNWKLRNQVYFDFNGFDQQKYYDKVTLSYKITDYFFITSQVNWVTAKAPTKRIGITVLF